MLFNGSGESYDCPSVNEVTLKDLVEERANQIKTKHEKMGTLCKDLSHRKFVDVSDMMFS